MKKLFFICGVLALAVAAFAMFKILTFNENGNAETNQRASEVETEEEKSEGRQTEGEGKVT